MTEQEVKEIEVAIKHIEARNMSAKHLDVAIKALKKQIPMKLDIETRADGDCVCGDCFEPIPRWDTKYCPECGQKIDWSDEK